MEQAVGAGLREAAKEAGAPDLSMKLPCHPAPLRLWWPELPPLTLVANGNNSQLLTASTTLNISQVFTHSSAQAALF